MVAAEVASTVTVGAMVGAGMGLVDLVAVFTIVQVVQVEHMEILVELVRQVLHIMRQVVAVQVGQEVPQIQLVM